MGSCAAPSAKGDDKFITTDYLQQCHFDDYLLPAEKFAALKREQALPPAINPNSDQYRKSVCSCWTSSWPPSPARPRTTSCPDAILTESGLKITPLDAAVPDRAQALIDQTSQLLPRIKITELLMDVDDWTGFSRHFTHLKDGAEAKDRTLLLSAILGDAINLGLTKMAESSPGLTYAKLSRCKPGTSATKPIRRPWPSWSTTSIATPLPPTGATARPHPPMASASGAGGRGPGAYNSGHVNSKRWRREGFYQPLYHIF